MSRPAPTEACSGVGYTSEEYLDLVTRGLLAADDRVELLGGVVVSMSPQSPDHAAGVTRVRNVLLRTIAGRAEIREEKPLVAGPRSVPEPDIAVVAGTNEDYAGAHPTTALLVVEVADSSLPQDRLTKAAIYAAAGIPEYWIVSLRDDHVEVRRAPDARTGVYREQLVAGRGMQLDLVAFSAAAVAVADLLPPLADG